MPVGHLKSPFKDEKPHDLEGHHKGIIWKKSQSNKRCNGF
jgi:hypothetical protein